MRQSRSDAGASFAKDKKPIHAAGFTVRYFPAAFFFAFPVFVLESFVLVFSEESFFTAAFTSLFSDESFVALALAFAFFGR